jgi:hypothetical protein
MAVAAAAEAVGLWCGAGGGECWVREQQDGVLQVCQF